MRVGSVTARHSSSERQPNFAALNRRRHLCSAGRPSRWALAHMSSFGDEFPLFCNYCVVMADDLKSHDVEKKCLFLRFLKLTTPYGKIIKILFRKESSPIDVLCSNFMKYDPRETGKNVSCLPDNENKISPMTLQLSVGYYCADRAQNLTGQGQPQISSKSTHFRRSYTRMREHHQNRP